MLRSYSKVIREKAYNRFPQYEFSIYQYCNSRQILILKIKYKKIKNYSAKNPIWSASNFHVSENPAYLSIKQKALNILSVMLVNLMKIEHHTEKAARFEKTISKLDDKEDSETLIEDYMLAPYTFRNGTSDESF